MRYKSFDDFMKRVRNQRSMASARYNFEAKVIDSIDDQIGLVVRPGSSQAERDVESLNILSIISRTSSSGTEYMRGDG